MQNNQELAPLEIVEMFVTVFCCLKDSSEVIKLHLLLFYGMQSGNGPLV